MALPVSVFERAGYFDEHPSLRMAGEDNEWAYRALRAGVPIKYEPDAVVHHAAWMKRSDLVSLHRRYARGQGSFYGKYLLRLDAFILRRAVRDLVRAPWLLLRGTVTLNWDLIAMGFGEITGLPVGIVAGMRMRRK
jgi:GT2 family glycosyltransferase